MNDESAPKQQIVGRPWPKGVSGNPKGKPKSLASRLRAATHNGKDLIDVIVGIAKGTIDAPAKVRLEAAEYGCDHIFGKAPQVALNVNADAGSILDALTLDDLRMFYEGVAELRSRRIASGLAAQTAATSIVDAPKVPDPLADP